jgi:hypothetical protein
LELFYGCYKKYLNEKIFKDEENRKAILGIFYAISMIFYLYFKRGIISEWQWDILCNPKTLLFVHSSFWMGLIEMFSGAGVISSALLYVFYKIMKRRTVIYNNKQVCKYNEGINSAVFSFIISLCFVLISSMSYCRIDRDGLYVREIRTLFVERKHSWKSIESVDINYYKSKSDYNIQYMINFDGFFVDADDAGLTMNNKKLMDQGMKEIHRIVKANGITINKDIEKYNDEINEFLKLIGEK